MRNGSVLLLSVGLVVCLVLLVAVRNYRGAQEPPQR